ncbi:translation initiation factor IF-2-like [Accipiter gentilis]|uniref:translation initiation factor IF-2-like n=1 Tax=Astur gentilis TaxID=8957 RepID=UPI0021103DA3|nr:translation initiation factor IF-2-like [Accipiter gentilis]
MATRPPKRFRFRAAHLPPLAGCPGVVAPPPPPRPSAAARGGLGPARPSASLARRPSAAPALPEPAAPGRPRPGGQTRRLQRTPPAPIRPGLPAAAAPPPRAPAERGGGTERPLQNANAAAGGGGGGGLGLGSLPGGSSWPTHTQGGFTHASRHTRGGAARAPGTSSPSRRFQAHAPPPPDFPEPFSCPPTPFLANPARGNGSFPRRNQRLPRLPPPPPPGDREGRWCTATEGRACPPPPGSPPCPPHSGQAPAAPPLVRQPPRTGPTTAAAETGPGTRAPGRAGDRGCRGSPPSLPQVMV